MIDTIYNAFFYTMKYILLLDAKIIDLMAVCIAFAVWTRRTSYEHRAFGLAPALITLAVGKAGIFYWSWFGNTIYLFADRVTVRNFADVQPYIALVLSVWLIFNILIDLYLIFGDDLRSILYQVLFLAGFAAVFAGDFLANRSTDGVRLAGTEEVAAGGNAYLLSTVVRNAPGTIFLAAVYGLWGLISLRMIVLVWKEGTKRQKTGLAAVLCLGGMYLVLKVIKNNLG